MTQAEYERISGHFRSPRGLTFITWTNRLSEIIGYAAFPILVILMCIAHDSRLLRTVLVPAAGFIILTIIRRIINRPRPYEAMPIQPLIKKDASGRSMPSRHAYSIFAIAMVWLLYCWPIGCVLLITGILLCYVRVVAGLHYPEDVLVGSLSAIIWHVIWLWLI